MAEKVKKERVDGKSFILINLFLGIGIGGYFFGKEIIRDSGYTTFTGSLFSGFTLGVIVSAIGVSIILAMGILNVVTIISLIIKKSVVKMQNKNEIMKKNHEI